jgi:hypothetical protein
LGRRSDCKVCSSIYDKKYKALNAERDKQNKKKWHLKNKETIQQRVNSYELNRRKTDKFFNFTKALRNLVRISITNRGYKKTTKAYRLLGADFETVFAHLKQTAVDNYGFYDQNIKYHIDHKIPCSSVNTEEELVKLQHYTNLQYLSPSDNLSKSDKLDWKL